MIVEFCKELRIPAALPGLACTAIESQIRRVISRDHDCGHGFVIARRSLMEIEGLMVSGPGSVDRHFGYTAPEGKEHTWIVVRINRIEYYSAGGSLAVQALASP